MSNNKPTVTSKTALNLKVIVWSLILSIVVIVALVAGWWLLLKKDDLPQVNTEETGTPITASENLPSPIKQPEEVKSEQSKKEAQEKAIKSFQDKLKEQKFNKCEWKASISSRCKKKLAVPFICNISNVDDPKLDQWINGACDVLQSERTEINGDINYCLENNKAMMPVIDFFLQEFSTNKEILCPTTNPQ